MKKPKIIIVDNATAVTGGIIAIRNATDHLLHHYDFVYVLPSGSKGSDVLRAAGYRVHELPFVEVNRRVRSLLLYVPMLLINGWRLGTLMRQEQAAILHMNDFYNLTGIIARILTGRPLITHVRFMPHSQLQPLARIWRWIAENLAQRVVCVSTSVYSYFRPLPSVRIIYDPIPEGEKYPLTTLAPRADGTVRVLYLSNYIVGKGQNFAVEAFKAAYLRQPTLRLHFAGGDMGLKKNQEYRRQLEATVTAAGLEQVITFSGFVQDVEAALKQTDIVLNFSESESFSLTCLDALYFGIPLIATDCGGPSELFESGHSGLLVPNRDVLAMTEALVALAASAGLRQQFATAGRAFVRQKFRASATYEQLGKLYWELLNN